MPSDNDYMRKYMLERYYKRRAWAIESLGGKCRSCGTAENLELDHIDPASKTAEIARVWSCSKKRFEEEVAKCQLLCKECHLEKSYANGDLPPRATHGTHAMYRHHQCRCDDCKLASRLAIKKSRDKKKETIMPSKF